MYILWLKLWWYVCTFSSRNPFICYSVQEYDLIHYLENYMTFSSSKNWRKNIPLSEYFHNPIKTILETTAKSTSLAHVYMTALFPGLVHAFQWKVADLNYFYEEPNSLFQWRWKKQYFIIRYENSQYKLGKNIHSSSICVKQHIEEVYSTGY